MDFGFSGITCRSIICFLKIIGTEGNYGYFVEKCNS
jgi:hypothetical protein